MFDPDRMERVGKTLLQEAKLDPLPGRSAVGLSANAKKRKKKNKKERPKNEKSIFIFWTVEILPFWLPHIVKRHKGDSSTSVTCAYVDY